MKIMDKVYLMVEDGPDMSSVCGPATVLALDIDSAWIRYTYPDAEYHYYRSVDINMLQLYSRIYRSATREELLGVYYCV